MVPREVQASAAALLLLLLLVVLVEARQAGNSAVWFWGLVMSPPPSFRPSFRRQLPAGIQVQSAQF